MGKSVTSINPRILIWARERAVKQVEEVAEAMGKAPGDIMAWSLARLRQRILNWNHSPTGFISAQLLSSFFRTLRMSLTQNIRLELSLISSWRT
jgi:hypothetical protein